MRRIIMTLTLFTPACDDPDQLESEPAFIIEMSASEAHIRSEEGELLVSAAPDALRIAQEEEGAAGVGSLDQLSIVPEDPLAGCWMLYDCVSYANGWTVCKARPVSPGNCAAL